jgi:hypothetical protein
MKKEWSDFVKANSGYFQISRETDDMVHLNTREHGSIGDEEYGQEDADYARYIIKKVKEKYPKTRSRLYNIDEWVELELTYVPDEKEVPKKSFEDYKKELYKNINKEWKGKKHNGWEYLGMDLAGVIDWQKGDYTVKATPFWDKSKDTIAIDAIKYEDSILYVDEIPFEPTYDIEKDTDRYIKLIEKEFSKTTSGTFADGGMMAKGGSLPNPDNLYALMELDEESGYGSLVDERVYTAQGAREKKYDLEDNNLVKEGFEIKIFTVSELLRRKSLPKQSKQNILDNYDITKKMIDDLRERFEDYEWKVDFKAKGGKTSDEKMIYKIQNMMDDERMTLKLQKEFEGKDLFDDEIVDEYVVKQFDYSEDDDKIEKFIRMKKNKFYVVPFDNQDDSYYYILVPKDKMAKGGATSKYNLGDNVVYYNREGKITKISKTKGVYVEYFDGAFDDDDSGGEWLDQDDEDLYKADEDYADGGMMAKGGKIEKALYNIDKWMPEDFELQREYYQLINDKDQKGMEEFLDMYADQDRLMRYGIQYEDLGKLAEAIISGSNYAKGGKLKSNPAKFRDKVKAISKKLVGTKVPKKYKKDYGATYDKQEANTAARRISGAKLAELKAKLAKKTKTKKK